MKFLYPESHELWCWNIMWSSIVTFVVGMVLPVILRVKTASD